MIIDSELTFSSGGLVGQGLAGFTGTVSLGNTVDSGPLGGQVATTPANVGRDWGMGDPMWLYAIFVLAPVGIGATIDVQVVTSAAPNLSSPNVMLDLTGVLPVTSGRFATGSALRGKLPRGGIGGSTGWLRYIGVNFIVGGNTLSGGGVLAFLSHTVQDNLVQAAGYVVQ